ncbi:MAG: efflux RND transporter periplasmic adaptor subunit [Cyanobacteria bacterium P01_G01_bin.19]
MTTKQEKNEQEKNPKSALELDERRETVSAYEIATKKPKRGFLLGAIALLIGGTLFWRAVSSNEQPAVETTNIEQARLTVKTVEAAVEPIQAWSYGDGFVSAKVKKHLNFQSEGTIDYIKQIDGRDLQEGDRVTQGELLAKLDPRRSDADITVATSEQTRAQNEVANAVASLRQAEADLEKAEADLQKAQTDTSFAEADLARYQELAAEGAVERREVTVKETEYKNAVAIQKATEAGIRLSQSKVAAAQTQVKSAEAGVKAADAKLSQSSVDSENIELIAPFDGVISRLNIREGEYWTPQLVNVAGDYQGIVDRVPMILIDPNAYEVDVELPAFQGSRIKSGQRAFIVLDRDRAKATSGRITGEDLMELASASGTVLSVSPSVSPGERSVRVTIRIDRGTNNLQDGEQISAWIATEEKDNATVAPFNAIVSRDRANYVFVVNEADATVEQRQIEQGIEGLSKKEIIEGVEPGEQLVTEGKNRLVNGAPVEIIP